MDSRQKHPLAFLTRDARARETPSGHGDKGRTDSRQRFGQHVEGQPAIITAACDSSVRQALLRASKGGEFRLPLLSLADCGKLCYVLSRRERSR